MAEDQNEFDQIVDNALDLMKTGGATLESVLELYPDSAEALRPQLEAALWLDTRKTLFDLPPGYLRASRRKLVESIQHEVNPQPLPFWVLWRRLLPPRQPAFGFTPALRVVLALVLLVSFAFTGQAMVLTARAAVPGDALYSLKTVQEKLQLAASLTEGGDARLHIRFAQRRLVEIESLIMENRYNQLSTTVGGFEEQVSQAIGCLQELAGQDSDRSQALVSQLQDLLASHTPVITVLSAGLPPKELADIQRALGASAEGLSTVQGLLVGESPPVNTDTIGTPLLPSSSPVVSTLFATPSAVASPLPGQASAQPSTTPLPITPESTSVAASPSVLPGVASDPSLKPTSTPTQVPDARKTPKPTRKPKPTKDPKSPPNPTRRPPKP